MCQPKVIVCRKIDVLLPLDQDMRGIDWMGFNSLPQLMLAAATIQRLVQGAIQIVREHRKSLRIRD
jgi:hypothetical protein